MKKTGMISSCLLLLVLVHALSARAGAAELGEYEIKSGMLYNFISFIEWPPEVFDKAEAVDLCIAGDISSNRPFFRLQGKQQKGRRIVVRQVTGPGGTMGCSMLFINRSEGRRLAAYLQAAHTRSILTVGDSDGFAANGGIIGFIEQDGRVRFEINVDAAQRSKIRISSQLLKLARIVAGRK